MATNYRYLAYELQTDLKSAYPDADIQFNQVLFWIRTVENQMRARHLKSTESGAYLAQFDDVPVLVDGIRKYVVLPAAVYDMAFENGIEYITYERNDVIAFTSIVFQATSPAGAPPLYDNPYTKPTPSNPYFYRVNQRIYFLGVEDIKLKKVEMGIYSALDPRASVIDLDSSVGLNEEQVHQLRIEVLNLGKFVLVIPKDRVEDGTDDRTSAQATRLQTTMTAAQQQAAEAPEDGQY